MLFRTRRWQMVLSKNFLLARYVKLSAVHGAWAVSTSILIAPTLVSRVIVWVPVRGSPVAGGLPTSLVFFASSGSGDALALGSTIGCQTQFVGVAEPDGFADAWSFFLSSL